MGLSGGAGYDSKLSIVYDLYCEGSWAVRYGKKRLERIRTPVSDAHRWKGRGWMDEGTGLREKVVWERQGVMLRPFGIMPRPYQATNSVPRVSCPTSLRLRRYS